MNANVHSPDKLNQELVVFRTSGQDFGVNILSVREIRGWTKPACLPHSPSYVMGVINLRGAVVPIVDLAARLGLPAVAADERHVIIVTRLESQVVGFLIEAVTDILSIQAMEIQPPPDVASDSSRAFLRGVIAKESRLIRMIDFSHLMPRAESVGSQ